MACSSGPEVYSIALTLESIKEKFSDITYHVTGEDVDKVSIEKARRAIYPIKHISSIKKEHKKYILFGKGKYNNLFSLDSKIKNNCSFKVRNVVESESDDTLYDVIFCRNLLIYFSPSTQQDRRSPFLLHARCASDAAW